MQLLGLAALLSITHAGFGSDAHLVLDWNALMLDAIRQSNSGPTLGSRNLAMFHAAIYDAVNSIARTHQPYRFLGEAPPGASEQVAAVAASYRVMVSLYPSMKSRADALYQSQIAVVPATALLSNSVALGERVAGEMLESRKADGSTTSVPYIPSDAPGQWRRTPPFYRPPLDPHWRYVTPFCLPDIEPFAPTKLPALDSAEYAAAFNEVKALGGKNSEVRTAEQGEIAVFWSDFSYTAMPPGHWHQLAAGIVRDQQTSLADTARLFALISLAQADAAIVCWETKFRFNSWRPVTAIQRAAEDGNPATEPDESWEQFLPSPPFPEYPSGHSTFSKASAQVLTRFYGRDDLAFSATSDTLPGVERNFASLAACADEVGMSRIYGGFHFQFANRDGKASGEKIGNYVAKNFLLPNGRLPMVVLEGLDDGVLRMRMHGQLGSTCVLEESTDLTRWQPVSTNVAVVGGTLVTRDVAGPASARFFRVR